MVQYDPTVIDGYAARLYRQAFVFMVGFAFVSTTAAMIAGGMVASSLLRGPDAAAAASIGCGIFGLRVGYAIGQGRANTLRLQAQMALCQMQIEKNTGPAPPPRAPPCSTGEGSRPSGVGSRARRLIDDARTAVGSTSTMNASRSNGFRRTSTPDGAALGIPSIMTIEVPHSSGSRRHASTMTRPFMSGSSTSHSRMQGLP